MANDLISRQALLAEYDRVHIGPTGGARKLIEDAPTVDAVEVVHGRWADEFDGKYANPKYICSRCTLKALYKEKRDVLGNWQTVQALTDYCPNCGAKMDAETLEE